MLIGLGLMVFAILFGGPQNDLILTQIDKYVKKEVVDDNRKTIVITELKEIKKIQKQYTKKTKKYTKALGKLIDQQTTSDADYKVFFNSVVEYENQTNEVFLPHRLLIQETLTDHEWNVIADAAKKKIKKDDKTKNKSLNTFNKNLGKIKTGILKSVAAENKDKATKVINTFNDKVMGFAEDIFEHDQQEREILLKREATKNELMTVVNDDIQSWRILFDEFSTLHNELAKVVPEKKWKSVAKALKKLF
jgi:hypothetical protein